MEEGILKGHNLYIIRCYGKDRTLIKLGYTDVMKTRWRDYITANPLIEVIGTYFRHDAKEFERWFHMNHTSIYMNEWYDESMLQIMLDTIKYEQEGNYTGTHTFYHKNGNVHHNVTRDFMYKTYGLPLSALKKVVLGKLLSVKGWSIIKDIDIHDSKRHKNTFYHYNGTIEKDKTVEFMGIKYGLPHKGFHNITSGNVRTNYGWSLDPNIINEHSYYYTTYNFTNDIIIENNVTIQYMVEKYPELLAGRYYLLDVCKLKRTEFKSWRLLTNKQIKHGK